MVGAEVERYSLLIFWIQRTWPYVAHETTTTDSHVWHRWKNKNLQDCIHARLLEQNLMKAALRNAKLGCFFWIFKVTGHSQHFRLEFHLLRHDMIATVASVICVNSLLGIRIWLAVFDADSGNQAVYEQIIQCHTFHKGYILRHGWMLLNCLVIQQLTSTKNIKFSKLGHLTFTYWFATRETCLIQGLNSDCYSP